ncbi:MAG: hypothetical protein PHS59_01835 [Paludibacter sp.]|nr:hypothetical protein [Paludibacter sp.]
MKKIIFLINILILALTSCSDNVSEVVTYKINEPVFMDAETFRNSVKVTSESKAIETLGKICFYEGYLYISEPEKGIHIIDNRNPANPQIIGFIELLGNGDLSIRNGLLYADSFIDLVWFNISNPAQPTLKGRLEDVFVTALPKIDNEYSPDYNMCYNGDSTGIIVGWKLKERKETVTNYTGYGYWGWGNKETMTPMMDGAYSSSTSSTGITGSMSRFTIYNGNLYTVINNALNIFSLDGEKPEKVGDNTYLNWNVETIFSYKDNLFFGTTTGMIIYSVTDPLNPIYQSCITHAYACDPVVVDNDLAYITIHSGSICDVSASKNSLIIVDVKDIKNPKEIVSHDMTCPKGLGIDDGKLFLCDDGLKIYTIGNDPRTLMSNQIAHYKGMDGYDVIANNNTLIMIADNGLYQYDYSNLNDIKQVSKIDIGIK